MSSPESERPFRNPFRSEQDAFRVVIYIVLAGLIIFLAATLIATWLGVVLAIVAVALGLIKTVQWLAELLGTPEDPEESTEGNEHP